MSRTHELKCWPSCYDAIDRGEKTFEVRRNDRDFAVGDVLVLQKFDPHSRSYEKRNVCGWVEMRVAVTYVMSGGQLGIEPHFCVLGIKRIGEEKP